MRETPLVYTDIVFNAKPDAVPYNYRISYKVTQLCLIMRICGRGDVCSLIKLHMISFALISQENMRKLVDFADGIGSAPIVRFDPSVNRALTYVPACRSEIPAVRRAEHRSPHRHTEDQCVPYPHHREPCGVYAL